MEVFDYIKRGEVEGGREVVEANKERVKIINTGVKAFARLSISSDSSAKIKSVLT